MFLYHATDLKNLDSILQEGIRPEFSWDADLMDEEEPSVCAAATAQEALLEAYIADDTKVECGEKEKMPETYIALRIDVRCYRVGDAQGFSFIYGTIARKDFEPILKESAASIAARLPEYLRNV